MVGLSPPQDIDESTSVYGASTSVKHIRDIMLPLPLEQQAMASFLNSASGCTRVFATFTLANTHDLNVCDRSLKEGPLPCPWKCGETFSNRARLVAHYKNHNTTQQGNQYTCRRGCNTHWPNAYPLTIHEDKRGTQYDRTASRVCKVMKFNFGPETGKHSTLNVAHCCPQLITRPDFFDTLSHSRSTENAMMSSSRTLRLSRTQTTVGARPCGPFAYFPLLCWQ